RAPLLRRDFSKSREKPRASAHSTSGTSQLTSRGGAPRPTGSWQVPCHRAEDAPGEGKLLSILRFRRRQDLGPMGSNVAAAATVWREAPKRSRLRPIEPAPGEGIGAGRYRPRMAK